MKNIVKFSKVNPQGKVTLDCYSAEFEYLSWEELLDQYLPYTRIFEHIVIRNFKSIPTTLLVRLTNQYLHGAKIEVDTPSRKFKKVYQVARYNPFYSYKWTPLDMSAPVPKSLAEFVFEYEGKKTTYLNAIKTLTTTRYIPNEIWNALDVYSRQQIDRCRELNRGDYSLAELWYKELMKDCFAYKMKMFSPNEKTYYEAVAELDFDKACQSVRLQEGLRPLNPYELSFLNKYARAYGVEIPKFQWKINSRKTNHGYTAEPERVTGGMSTEDWNKVTFDPRNTDNLPKFVRQGLKVRECDSDRLLREAYFQLKWIMKNLKDEGLMPGYHRCPECHQIYKEHEGCECGHCMPIEFVSADNLLYGNSSTYEDYESTSCAYEDLSEEEYDI